MKSWNRAWICGIGLAALTFATVPKPTAVADDEPLPSPAPLKADSNAGKKLLNEGDALADRNKPNEAVIQYKRAFEQILPGLRGLSFRHEVKRDVTPREDLKALLIKEIDEQMTPRSSAPTSLE